MTPLKGQAVTPDRKCRTVPGKATTGKGTGTPAQPQSERETDFSVRDPSQAMGAARQDCGGVELPWCGLTDRRLTIPITRRGAEGKYGCFKIKTSRRG